MANPAVARMLACASRETRREHWDLCGDVGKATMRTERGRDLPRVELPHDQSAVT